MKIKVNKYDDCLTRFRKPSQLAVKAEIAKRGQKLYEDGKKRSELRRRLRGQKSERPFGDPLGAYRPKTIIHKLSETKT